MTFQRILTGAAALTAAATLAACSSSGGGGVSTSKLEAKLKSEPQIKTVLAQGGTQSDVASKLVDCIAKALEKQADPDDLKKYVDGKINAADVSGKDKSADQDIKTEAATCAKSVVQQASSSAAAGS